MNVLVTGGGGFIGSVLCEKLLNLGCYVTCLDNFHNSTPASIARLARSKSFFFQKFDVSNPYLTKPFKYDAIIHLAGLVGFPRCANNQTLSMLWNIKSTQLMADLARRSDARFLYASTGSVYGRIENLCTEESSTNPVSVYGADKLEAEKIVRELLPKSISLRFATGFGVSNSPRFDLLPNNLLFDAMKNKSLSVFQKDAKRTFISVDQMAEAFIHCLQNYESSKHQVYNVGTEKLNMTKFDLVQKIKKFTNFEVFFTDGLDPDQRDYEVSYNRIKEFGFEVKDDMDEQLDRLYRIWSLYV